MLKVGITGNIASGKTQIENIIKQFGYSVFDLDLISHKLLVENEEIKEKIILEFQTLDRKELSKIVFSDKNKLKKLEEIIHPELKKFCLKTFKKDEKIIFISGALLYEAGFSELFDKIIFIDSKKEIRLKRLMERNSLSKKEALLRLEFQNTNNKSKADYIIENNNSLNELKVKINSILHELTYKL